IFYPHTNTLAYSESNLGAGVLAIPAYWTTKNALAAHNFAALVGLLLSAAALFYLVRVLTGDGEAAAVSAIGFGFTTFVVAHGAPSRTDRTASCRCRQPCRSACSCSTASSSASRRVAVWRWAQAWRRPRFSAATTACSRC